MGHGSSGAPPCGFLDDQQVEGAGLVLQTSGVGYNSRRYDWIYKAPNDATQTCLDWRDDAYSRSTWNSNISVALESGCFYKGDRLIGRDNLSLLTENNCYGIFINRDDDIIQEGVIGRNEVQKIEIGEANKGTFTLSFGGQTTSAIAYDATAATVEDALEALSSIGSGNVVVTGNAKGPYIVTFAGTLAYTNVATITINTSGLSLDGSASGDDLTKYHFSVTQGNHSTYRDRLSYGADLSGSIRFELQEGVQSGTFKIRYRRETMSTTHPEVVEESDVVIETADIPFDATMPEIAAAINGSFAANDLTGWVVTPTSVNPRGAIASHTVLPGGSTKLQSGSEYFRRGAGTYGDGGRGADGGITNYGGVNVQLFYSEFPLVDFQTQVGLQISRGWNDKYKCTFYDTATLGVDTTNIKMKPGKTIFPQPLFSHRQAREAGIDALGDLGRVPLQNLYVRLRILDKQENVVYHQTTGDPSLRYKGVSRPNAEYDATNQAAFYSGDKVSKVQDAVNNAFGAGIITVSSVDSSEAGWVSDKSFKTGKKWSAFSTENGRTNPGGDYHDRNVENSLSYGGLFFTIADASIYSDITKYELVLEPYYWGGVAAIPVDHFLPARGASIWSGRKRHSGESKGIGNTSSNFYGGLRLDDKAFGIALMEDLKNTAGLHRYDNYPDLEAIMNYFGWGGQPRQGDWIYKSVIGDGVLSTTEVDPVTGTVTVLTEGNDNISLSMMPRSAVYVTKEHNIKPNPLSPQGTLANVTDVNFIATSGNPSLNEESDYEVTYMSLASGVKVGQKFVSRSSRKVTDAPSSKDKIVGFGVTYIDEKDEEAATSQTKDRLTISAYDDVVSPVDAVTIMRSDVPAEGRDDSTGLFGVTNMPTNPLPQTIFNVQATGESIARLTSHNDQKPSLQLLHGNNFPEYGFEAEYNVLGRRVDMSVFHDFEKSALMSLDATNKYVGFATLTPNEMITVSGHDGGSASISLSEQDFTPNKTEGFGKIYVKPKSSTVNQNQTQAVMFLDDGGNSFDLTFNKFDVEEGMILYSDVNKNTYGGISCPDNRTDVISQGQQSNTAYGHSALNKITTGDGNLAIGVDAGKSITAGSNNVILGSTANDLTIGSKNIAIGYNNFVGGENSNNNIIIGNDELGKNLNLDNTLLIGHGSRVLIKGTLGPNDGDKNLTLPNGALSITSTNEIDTLKLTNEDNYHGSSFGAASIIEKIDTNSDWPDAAMAFIFTGSGDAGNDGIYNREALFSLRHNAEPMTGRTSYFTASPARPTAELRGDLNLRGAIRFGDGTSINSSSGTVIIAGSGLSSQINVAEGNQQFDLNIEELSKSELQATITAENSYLALSTDSKVGKISISELNPFVGAGLTRILDNYNHAFTDTSTIDTVSNSYTNYFGYRAGHDSSGIQYTNFMGPEAGYEIKTADYSNFFGYRAGYQADNAQHAVFIGSSAGYNADDSAYSIFIGDSAGQNTNSSRSIGIGDNALESVTGTMNIELTAGVGGSNRIIGNGNISNKLAIGNIIGGDMNTKKVSVGVANVSPTATLQVQSSSSADTNLQEWKNEAGTVVAYLTRNGDLYLKGTVNVSGIA